MKTLSLMKEAESVGDYGGDGSLKYDTSTTDTQVEISLSRISGILYRRTSSTSSTGTGISSTMTYTVKLSGAISLSLTGTYKSTDINGHYFNVTKVVKRTHAAQSVKISATLKYAANTGSTAVTASNSVTISIPAKPSYSVSYLANGGTDAPSAQTKWHDESLTLSSAKPSRTGYAFRRWNVSQSDTGTAYDPGSAYAANAAMSLYAIWNPLIQYNPNGTGVGGMPSTQTKTFGTSISLSNNVPTRSGYAFDGWYKNTAGTGTKYTPGQSYTSNEALTLYAKWLKVPSAPSIRSITVVRCGSNGTPDDTGTYCKVTSSWAVDTTSDTVADNTGTVTGTIKAQGTSTARSISFSSGASGTSGTAIAIVSGCDTDAQYYVTVTVTDKVASTSRSDVLTRAKFVMDFHAGGNGIGVGCAAPEDGFECGWPAQFDEDLTILGDVNAANLSESYDNVVANVISASGTWTVSGASVRKCGHLCQLYLYVKNSSALAAGAGATPVGTISAGNRPKSIITFGCPNGGGYITTGGAVYFRPFVAVSANAAFYIAATYYC